MVRSVFDFEFDCAKKFAHLELDGIQFPELILVPPCVGRKFNLRLDSIAVVEPRIIRQFPNLNGIVRFRPDDRKSPFTTSEVSAQELQHKQSLGATFPRWRLSFSESRNQIKVQRQDGLARYTHRCFLRARCLK